MARFHVRAALGFHGLDDYAEDAGIITSKLVTNAVQHVRDDGTETIGVTLARTSNPPADGEQGRGLRIVEALSAHWGWRPQDGGKAVFAVLAWEA